MEMTGVEAEQFLPCDGVAQVKLVRANRAALSPDAKELRLDRVKREAGRERLLEYRIERSSKPFAWSVAVRWRVLEAVGNPHVGHAGLAQRLAHRRADLARANAVFDPELPNGRVAMRQRKSIGRFGMRKTGRIKVQPEAL